MNNKISHSAVTVYKECPAKYFNHYREKLRSVKMGSALLFGSAVDKGLECALQNFHSPDMNMARETFLKHWKTAELNGVTIDVETSDLVTYSKSDHELNENPWESLKTKGLMMIDAYYKDVFPNIDKVITTQEEIALTNDVGDSVTGFADCVLQWKGEKAPVIMDFKTSARKYPPNAVKESPQLSLYKHSLSEKHNTIRAGFIVFIKAINKNASKICSICGHDGSETSHKTCANMKDKKRCGGELIITYNPKVDVQVLIDDIDEAFENSILESFDNVNTKLQEEDFTPNWNSCMTKYGPCIYSEYCKHGSTVGLVKVESRKK